MNVSVVDRHDLEAKARAEKGWISIFIRNVVEVPAWIAPGETLIVVIIPETRAPLTEAEERQKVISLFEKKGGTWNEFDVTNIY